MIKAIIFQHDNPDDISMWTGFNLSKSDREVIEHILLEYDTEGYSVRGTRSDIAEEIKTL